jgi:hypothetical protein
VIDLGLIRIRYLARWETLMRQQHVMPVLAIATDKDGVAHLLADKDIDPAKIIIILESMAAELRAGDYEQIATTLE